jgi:hypothetical protein
MNTEVQKQGTGNKATHDQIALQAYCLWQKAGCQQGHDLDYWLAAEKQLQDASRLSVQQRPIAGDPVQTPIQESRTTRRNHLRQAGNGQEIVTARSRS